jgi:hypothetical protein
MTKPRHANTPLIHVHWVDRGYGPKSPPNPEYPKGIDHDLTGGGGAIVKSCRTELPYPAKRCGYYVITCGRCHMKTIITTAGRPDDPKSVRLPCKARAEP